jgi:hypothetical protein
MNQYKVLSFGDKQREKLANQVEEFINTLTPEEQKTMNIQYQAVAIEQAITQLVVNYTFFAFVTYIKN